MPLPPGAWRQCYCGAVMMYVNTAVKRGDELHQVNIPCSTMTVKDDD